MNSNKKEDSSNDGEAADKPTLCAQGLTKILFTSTNFATYNIKRRTGTGFRVNLSDWVYLFKGKSRYMNFTESAFTGIMLLPHTFLRAYVAVNASLSVHHFLLGAHLVRRTNGMDEVGDNPMTVTIAF